MENDSIKNACIGGCILARQWLEMAMYERRDQSVIDAFQRIYDGAIENYKYLESKGWSREAIDATFHLDGVKDSFKKVA